MRRHAVSSTAPDARMHVAEIVVGDKLGRLDGKVAIVPDAGRG